MIRYIELTPNADITFQSGKIVRTAISEGDRIEVGDLLFVVNAQGKEADVLASKAGRVNELIVETDDVIHKLSSLLVLETIVEDNVVESTQENTKDNTKKEVTPPDQAHDTSKKGAQAKTAATKQARSKKPTRPRKKTQSKNNTKPKKGDSDNQSSLDFEQSNPRVSPNDSADTQETKITMNEIKVPDLGGADAVEVIDILVKVGDNINTDDPLITVESDKASMDIPAPSAGTIEEIIINVGDNVAEGDLIIKITGTNATESTNVQPQVAPVESAAPSTESEKAPETADTSSELAITIPDLGGAENVDVIELLVAVGESIEADQALITVESDKASMDVPSSHAGVIQSIAVNVGDKVNEGDAILTLSTDVSSVSNSANSTSNDSKPKDSTKKPEQTTPAPAAAQKAQTATVQTEPVKQAAVVPSGPSHASPSVRRLARELGVDLANVAGTSRKNRISKADVKAFVKSALVSGSAQQVATSTNNNGGAGIPEVPAQDFSKFGDIELQPLNKIKRVTAQHLHRSWLNVPHVTHNDETNIQSLEDFRKTLNAEYAKQDKGIKLSPLAFIVKAVVNALQHFPQFNSSLENGGNNLIVKKYYHIGIAVETPNGLMVPVIRDADKLSVAEIATSMGELAKKARDGKLTPRDMQGGTFSISSLGGIGGTNFTPLVNAPEVAILGVSRTKIQPVWNGSEFIPAPILPLSLSYDHRVIDGAEAARFTRHIAVALEDIRRLTV